MTATKYISETPSRAISIAGNYLSTFIKIDPEISKSNKLLKILVNSVYLIILVHLLTKLI